MDIRTTVCSWQMARGYKDDQFLLALVRTTPALGLAADFSHANVLELAHFTSSISFYLETSVFHSFWELLLLSPRSCWQSLANSSSLLQLQTPSTFCKSVLHVCIKMTCQVDGFVGPMKCKREARFSAAVKLIQFSWVHHLVMVHSFFQAQMIHALHE